MSGGSGALLAMIGPMFSRGGPTQEQVLYSLGVLGAGLLVWSLISAALFRAGVATYNRFATEEHLTTRVSFGRALLVGGLYVGAMVVVLFVLSIGLSIVFAVINGGFFGSRPDPTRTSFWYAWVAISWLAMLLAAWLVKSLLATAFAPSRFGAAALVGAAWSLYELLMVATFYGGLFLALYSLGHWPLFEPV